MIEEVMKVGPYAILNPNLETLDGLLEAGEYGYIGPGITGSGCQCGKCHPYSPEKSYRARVYLLDFQCDIDSREAIEEMKGRGLRPVNFLELLLLGKDYQDIQRRHAIVALGHIHYDHYFQGSVPALSKTVTDKSERAVWEYSLSNGNPLEKKWLKEKKIIFPAAEIISGEDILRYLPTCARYWGF
jgi:hypothetical protein